MGNNKKFILFLLIISLPFQTDAAESKIMKRIAKFLPTFTETTWMTNVVNVYIMVGRFVRVTNGMLNNYNQLKNQYTVMVDNMNKVYSSIENLKNIDPYNMDTWEVAFSRANTSLRYDVAEALRAFGRITYDHSLGAAEKYFYEITTLDDYAKAFVARQQYIDKKLISKTYEESLNKAISQYRSSTASYLQTRHSDLTQKAADPNISASEKNRLQKEIDDIEAEIKTLDSYNYVSVNDSLIAELRNIIAVNMNEIQLLQQEIGEFEEKAAELIETYTKLKNGETGITKTDTEMEAITDFPMNLDGYGTHPDQVTKPQAPEDLKPQNQQVRKEVSTQDILNASNAAEFLMLQQQAKQRDLLYIIAKTGAMILVVDAYEQKKQSDHLYAQDVAFKKMELGMRKASKTK